jgi:hypothetical protein
LNSLKRGGRIPLINPQRGIFKPQQMKFLLSIKTVFPKPGGKVWQGVPLHPACLRPQLPGVTGEEAITSACPE